MLTEVIQYVGLAAVAFVVILRVRTKRADRRDHDWVPSRESRDEGR